MILVFIFGTIGLVVLIGFLFVNLSPQFGGKASEEQKKVYLESKHFEKGLFSNEIPTSMDMSFTQGLGMMRKFITGVPNQSPKNLLPVLKIDSLDIANKPDSVTKKPVPVLKPFSFLVSFGLYVGNSGFFEESESPLLT